MCIAPKNQNQTKIINANDILETKVERLVKRAKETKDSDPVLKVASMPKLYGSVVRPGTPIYVGRSHTLVITYTVASLCWIAWSIYETSLLVFGICVLTALVGYDLLSGFLHVVFDNPDNLNLPILGQPCLEFQMHHHFPTDLVQRNFLDVLGDLNFVSSMLFAWNLFVLGIDVFNNPIVRCMAGLKLLMAYFGQFSHRSAHDPSSANNKAIQMLRTVGFMIPLEKHRAHHRPPHDTDFCLVGVCNPICNFLYHRVTRNRWIWMVGFGAVGLGGIAVESILAEQLLRSMGLVTASF